MQNDENAVYTFMMGGKASVLHLNLNFRRDRESKKHLFTGGERVAAEV